MNHLGCFRVLAFEAEAAVAFSQMWQTAVRTFATRGCQVPVTSIVAMCPSRNQAALLMYTCSVLLYENRCVRLDCQASAPCLPEPEE
eukprot:2485379-Amphidinium_carterae.2